MQHKILIKKRKEKKNSIKRKQTVELYYLHNTNKPGSNSHGSGLWYIYSLRFCIQPGIYSLFIVISKRQRRSGPITSSHLAASLRHKVHSRRAGRRRRAQRTCLHAQSRKTIGHRSVGVSHLLFPPRSLHFVLTAGEVLSAGKSGFLVLCRFFCIIIVFFLELLSLYNAVVPANRAFDAIHGSFFGQRHLFLGRCLNDFPMNKNQTLFLPLFLCPVRVALAPSL